MYRNAVELGLKRIIIEDSHIERTKALKILRRKKHSLLGLWLYSYYRVLPLKKYVSAYQIIH